ALPAFLSQSQKGRDSSAKSDARNLVSQVESCFTDQQSYGSCTGTDTLTSTGLNVVNLGTAVGANQVGVVDATSNAFTVAAVSKSGNSFSIGHSQNGTTTRTCTNGGSGSC